MVLGKQLFPVPLLAGIDSKNDEFQLPASSLIELENATFGTPGKLTKRNGFDQMPFQAVGTQIQSGEALAVYNDELLLFDGEQAFSYSPSLEHWLSKGTAVSAICKKDQLVGNSKEQYLTSSALLENFEIFTYTEYDAQANSNKVRFTVIDHTTKVRILDNALVDAAGIQSQLVLFQGKCYIFYIVSNTTSTNLVYKSWDPDSPFNLSLPVTLRNDINKDHPNYDVMVDGYVRIAVTQTSGDCLFVAYDTLPLTPLATPIVQGSGGPSTNGVALTTDGKGNTWLLYGSTTDIKAISYNDLGINTGLEQLIQTVSNVNRITCHPNEHGIRVYFEISDTDTSKYYINAADLSLVIPDLHHYRNELDDQTDQIQPPTLVASVIPSNYSIVVKVELIQSAYTENTMSATVTIEGTDYVVLDNLIVSDPPATFTSQPLLVNTGTDDVFLSTTLEFSPTINLVYNISIDIAPVPNYARIQVSNLGVFKRSVGLYSKPFLNGSNYYLLTQYNTNSAFVSSVTDTYQNCYFLLRQDAAIAARLMYEEGGKIASSKYKCLTQVILDNGQIVLPVIDLGFGAAITGLSRMNIDFAGNNSFIGVTASGTYNMVGGIVQSYDNEQFVENNFLIYPEDMAFSVHAGGSIAAGDYLYTAVYKSANNLKNPEYSTTAVTIPVTAHTNNAKVIFTIPTLRVTNKNNIMVQLYRTSAGQDVDFFLVGEVNSDPNIDSVQITDTLDDDTLNSQLPLYTTGGILDNFSPPSCNLMALVNERVWVAGLETPNQLYFSKTIAPGFALEFAQEFSLQCDPNGGDITALGEIDGRLIIFKESEIFYLAGDGPNNEGEQNDFASPQLISSDVGCISANSVVKTDMGLMFQSLKGIYLLDRSNSVKYLGSPVARYNHLDITSAKLMQNVNEVRFTTSSVILVYNYFVDKWSVWTNLGNLNDSENWDQYVVLTDKGIVKSEMDGTGLDDGVTWISMKFTSAWLNPGSAIQDFIRIWRVLFLCNYYTNHNLVFKFAYDYNNFDSQFTTVDASKLISTDRGYGDGYYGDDVYGGFAYPYNARIHLTRQKCSAVRISVSDTQNGPLYDEDNKLINSGRAYDISALTLEVGVKVGANKFRNNASLGSAG